MHEHKPSVVRDIAYLGAGRTERLDLYRPCAIDPPFPLVIFVDGGAFHSGGRSSHRSRAFSELIADAGYAVLAIDYALSKSSTGPDRWSAWPRNLLDVAAAVAYAREHGKSLQVDADRIVLVGASAGATLALLAGFGAAEHHGAVETARHIRGVVNLYGRADWLRNTSAERSPDSREAALAASPVHWIAQAATGPAVLTLHGDADSVVPVEQGALLDHALRARGLAHEFHRLEGFPHSFVLEREPSRVTGPLLGFLARVLRDTATVKP